MNAVRTNKTVLFLLPVLGAVGLATFFALFASGRGTYYCGHCELRTPDADAQTTEFIKTVRSIASKVPFADYAVGTKYNICNANYCVRYQAQFDGSFYAEEDRRVRATPANPGKAILIEPPPPLPPLRQTGPVRSWAPTPNPTGRAGCVTVGNRRPCPTLSR